jgi:RsiW-degrading membrane proteinase PrsW (M82 family)
VDPALLDFGHASILISLLLGVLCVGRIRSYDVHETESFLKLFLVAVYGGLMAAAASLMLYRIAGSLGIRSFNSWYGFLFLVGPIEEGAKYLAFRTTRVFYGPRLNESTDGVVYMAATALGFSLIENFMYANAGMGNGHLLWLRLLLATPGHILFSFPMGLSHYLAREEGHPRRMIAASFALACLNHGIYNNLCSLPGGIILAPAFLLLLWLALLGVLRYSHAVSPFRTSLGALLEHLPSSLREGLRCRQCGNAGAMPHFALGSLELQKCGDCGHYVISRSNALRLFHRLAPEFRNLKGEFRTAHAREGYESLYGVVHVHTGSGEAWFHGDLLDEKLAEITAGLRSSLERRPLIRFLFRAPLQPAPFPSRHPPQGERTRKRDLALAGLGIALCAAWGFSHLAGRRIASLHPALADSWQDSTLSVAYPKGWTLDVWTSEDGRQVSINLEAQGHAAMAIRSQAWEVRPVEAAAAALQDLLATLDAVETARRPLERWGRYHGSGTEVDLRSHRGRAMGLSVFAHASAGRSFLAVEMVEAGYREPLRSGMDMVRSTLRLKRKPAAPPDQAAAGASFPADGTVTRAIRSLLEARDLPGKAPGSPVLRDAPVPEPRPEPRPEAAPEAAPEASAPAP